MARLFVLNDAGDPMPARDAAQWSQWIDHHDVRVAEVVVGGVRISTCFHGLDMAASPAPALYETRLYLPGGRKAVAGRYRSRYAALAGHRVFTRVIQRIIIERSEVDHGEVERRLSVLSPYAHSKEMLSVFTDAGVPYDEAVIRSVSEASGYLDLRELGEAGWVAIRPLAFTYAIISGITKNEVGDRWCYHTYEKAKEALEAWDGSGEPKGWHRHPASGRRIDENGKLRVAF